MSLRSAFLVVAIALVAWVAPAVAQEKLGDLVASGGYEWIIGRWVATTDEGQKVEAGFDWAIDQCVVRSDLRMGDFQYQGMVVLSPTYQEAVDEGADNRGGIWKGTWSPAGYDLVRRIEHTSPDGQVRKGEMVYGRVDSDTITIAVYAVDSSGMRNAEPWNKLTYKRQQAKAALVKTAATTGRYTDYEKLGDLIAEGGYEWLIGKWVASDDSRTYEVEYKPILEQHGASVNAKIGDYQYLGMIMYVPSRQQIVEFGADNMSGVWKGTWEQDYSDAIHAAEYTKADGTTQKLQHVYVKVNNDEFKVKEYPVESDGRRATEPRGELIFKRVKPAASAK